MTFMWTSAAPSHLNESLFYIKRLVEIKAGVSSPLRHFVIREGFVVGLVPCFVLGADWPDDSITVNDDAATAVADCWP